VTATSGRCPCPSRASGTEWPTGGEMFARSRVGGRGHHDSWGTRGPLVGRVPRTIVRVQGRLCRCSRDSLGIARSRGNRRTASGGRRSRGRSGARRGQATISRFSGRAERNDSCARH
jgi:hypothetical protein